MSTDVRFESAAVPGLLSVVSLRGREALSETFRFELELSSANPNLPLDAMLGNAGALHLGPKTVEGVLVEIEQLDRDADGYRYRVVLAPRLALLSFAEKSRVHRDLSLPDLAEALVAAAGVAIERRLVASYPARPFLVQYRESDLAFLSRLLEAEGIAYRCSPTGAVVLSDHAEPGGACSSARMGLEVETFGCRRRMTARSLLLHDHDPARPNLPFEAEAVIDDAGFGTQVEHGAVLTTPEHAATLATRRAEALRVSATSFQGVLRAPVGAGEYLHLSGHFRADFNRDYLVTAVEHELHGGTYCARVSVITSNLAFRPPLRTPRPRVEGVMHASLDGRAPGDERAADEQGRYRVVMPFDLSGPREGAGSLPLGVIAPDEGVQLSLRPGASVVLAFVDGDLERPLITGVVPRARRAADTHVIRASEGALIEMSSRVPQRAGAWTTSQSGLPRERHLATVVSASGSDGAASVSWTAVAGATRYVVRRNPTGNQQVYDGAALSYQDSGLTNGTTYTYTVTPYSGDVALEAGSTASATPVTRTAGYESEVSGITDWIRFAVPHGDGKWSYLRYGEATDSTVTSTDETTGTFKESDQFDSYTSRYYGSNGEAGAQTFSWGDIESSDYDTHPDDEHSGKAANAHFPHGSSAGVMDYTDGNRTVITRGNQQTVVQGHRTDVILGDYRVVIPYRTQGVYDADIYGMRYRKQADGWRKTQWSHIKADNYSYGDTENFFWGFNFGLNGGLAVGGFLGAKLDLTTAMSGTVNVGTSVTVDVADKFGFTKGDTRIASTSQLYSATQTITLAIGKQKWHSSGWDAAWLTAAGVLAAGAAVGGFVGGMSDNPRVGLYTSAGVGAAAFFFAMLEAAKLVRDDAESPQGFPRIVMEGKNPLKPVLTLAVSADDTIELAPKSLKITIGGAAAGTVVEITDQEFRVTTAGGSGAGIMVDNAGKAGMTANMQSGDPALMIDAQSAELSMGAHGLVVNAASAQVNP
jgi:type VI secretion system VgrG family protein